MSERNPARFNTVPNAQNRSAEEQRRLIDEDEAEDLVAYEAMVDENNYNEAMAARELEAATQENDALAAAESRIMENPKARRLYMISQQIAELRSNGGEPEIIADKEARLNDLLIQYSTDAEAERDAALRAAETERGTVKGHEIRAAKEAEAEAVMVQRMEEADFLMNSTDPAWVSEKLEGKSKKTETPDDKEPKTADLDDDEKEPKKDDKKDDDDLEKEPKAGDVDDDDLDKEPKTADLDDDDLDKEPKTGDLDDDDDLEKEPKTGDLDDDEDDDVAYTDEEMVEVEKEILTDLEKEAAEKRAAKGGRLYKAFGRMHYLFNRGKDGAMDRYRNSGKKTKMALGAIAFAAAAAATWALVKNNTSPGHVDPSAIDAGGIPTGPETPVTPDVDTTPLGPDVPNDSDYSPNDGPDRESDTPADDGDSAPEEDLEVSSDAAEVEEGEGWFQTMSEMGIDNPDARQALIENKELMEQLVDMGIAYEDNSSEIGGYGINMPADGVMPQEARELIQAAYDSYVQSL